MSMPKYGESVSAQAGAYLEWCEYVKRMTPATILTKRKALERFLRVVELDDFAHLTNTQFDAWRATLAKEGKSGKTINNYSDHVACCVKWLKSYCKLEVALDLEIIVRAAEDDPEIVIYTEQELSRALAACVGPRDALILSLAFQSGLRLSELTTLRVQDIDGLAINVLGKNRKRRRTFMREDTREKLDKWLTLNEISEGYIFPSAVRYDWHIHKQHITNIIKLAFERAGINKRVHPHALRHTWFTVMLDSGAPLMDTAIMGGHTDPATTKRYYHVSPKRHSEIHQKFIPTANELGTTRSVDKRPQELL